MRYFDDWEFSGQAPPGKKPDLYHSKVEIRDGWGNLIGEVGDYEDLHLTFNAEAADVEASNITIPGSSFWSTTFMRANRQILLVHVLIYRDDKMVKMWTGRVDRSVRSMEGKQGKINVELISDKAWLNFIMAWSAPFGPLWLQVPKKQVKVGKAIGVMKQFLIDNLLRLQNRFSVLNPVLTTISTYQEIPLLWKTVQEYMWPLIVVPTPLLTDTSPIVALTVQMTPMSEVWHEVCKDYNLLPVIKYHVPGRDDPPPSITMTRPGLVFDIQDKDKARVQGDLKILGEIVKEAGIFIRGLFGRYDAPPVLDTKNVDQLRSYFGNQAGDSWTIFRTSDEHWFSYEVAAYPPTTSTSIAGGKSQDFLNEAIQVVSNGAIRQAFALLGVGFQGNFITDELSDMLLAYQAAEDPEMRKVLGPFTFFEEYLGPGTTAYSFDSAQGLRLARYNAIGYKTATFNGGIGTVLPFRPFEDFDLLDPVAWEDPDEDRLVPERMKEITYGETRDEGVSWEFRIGQIERPEEPWAIQQRRNEMFKKAILTALLAD